MIKTQSIAVEDTTYEYGYEYMHRYMLVFTGWVHFLYFKIHTRRWLTKTTLLTHFAHGRIEIRSYDVVQAMKLHYILLRHNVVEYRHGRVKATFA